MNIYLAGPAVFHSDMGQAYYQQCQHIATVLSKQHKLTIHLLIPTDNNIAEQASPQATARALCDANIAMIEAADTIVADLSPFRGHEPDCGTAFEVGYACALQKPCHTHSSDNRSMVDKYGHTLAADGTRVEDFGLPFNLMLSNAYSQHHASLADAMAGAVMQYTNHQPTS